MLGAPGPPRELAQAQQADIFTVLRDVERQAAALDPSGAETEAKTGEELAQKLADLVNRSLDLFGMLERLDEAQAALASGTDDFERWFTETTPVQAAPRLGDLCFASAFELKRVQRGLLEADGPDDRLEALEAARRKLLRALRAVLATDGTTTGSTPHDADASPYRAEDVECALAVRRLYANFRRALRPATDESNEGVLAALRYAAGALAALASEPAYAHVRASDRAPLRRLRDRMLIWARHDRSVSVGLELLEDVTTAADLLRGINRRQELRAHDVASIRELSRGPGNDAAAWLSQLEELFGLDDALDDHIEELKEALDAATVQRVLARLPELG